MKTEEILNIDCREEHGREKIESFLLKIKPLRKRVKEEGEITLEVLESVLHGLSIRYGYAVMQIAPYYEEKKRFVFFKGEVMKREENTNIWKGTVYGITLWELTAKMIIKIYGCVMQEKKKDE